MHGQLASGARFLNCHMSVHLDPFFECTSSEDYGQCAHVCTVHMCVHTYAHWLESSLLVHTKNVCKCVHASVHTCAHMCTHSLSVRAVKTLASVRMCALCTCKCAHMCTHSLCVRAVKTLASVRMRAHLHGPSLWKLQ